MALDITWAQAVAQMGGDEGRLTQYFKGDTSTAHPNFDAAKSVALGMMRSKITERYAADKYDAWTNPPDYVVFHLLSLMLGVTTAHDDGRPEAISTYSGIAAGWLDDVAASRARVIELEDAATPAELPTMQGIKARSAGRVADPENAQSTYNKIFSPL